MPDGGSFGLLRRPEHPQQATFLELFFDLVFIFTLGNVVDLISADLKRDDVANRWLALPEIGESLLLFLAMMWVWLMTAWTTSRFNPLRPPVQVAVLLTMVAALVMSATLPTATGANGLIFAGTYVAIQTIRSAYFALIMRGHALSRVHLREFLWFCVSGVPWIASAFVHGAARDLLWVIAIAIDYSVSLVGWPVPGLGRSRSTAWATATEHLGDRYQQFLIITLGETILVIGRAYGGLGTFNASRTMAVAVSFVNTVLLWRIYFYRAGQVLAQAITWSQHRVRLGRVAGWGHLAIIVGLILTAAGYELIIGDPFGQARPGWVLVIFGGPALYLIGRSVFEHIVFGRVSPPRIIGIVLLGAIGPFMDGLPPLAVLSATALVLLGVAVTDAIRAHGKPLEQPSPPH